MILTLRERPMRAALYWRDRNVRLSVIRTDPLDQLLRVRLGRGQGSADQEPSRGRSRRSSHTRRTASTSTGTHPTGPTSSETPESGTGSSAGPDSVQERTTQLVAVHRDLVIPWRFTVWLELGGDIRLVSARNVLLHVVALRVNRCKRKPDPSAPPRDRKSP